MSRFARGLVFASILLAGAAAQAAGPVLRVERVDASKYPVLRAYVSLLSSAGTAITGLTKENFKIYENKTNEVEPNKVNTLDAAGYGMGLVIVMQVSGAMLPIMEDIKKSAAGFIASLGDKDQVAVIIYSDRFEVLAPMGDKAAAAGAIAKIQSTGPEYLLFDGIQAGLSLFPVGASTAAKAEGAAPSMPAARALVVLGDGRDSGSQATLEGVIAEAKKRKVPIFSIGHSEVGGSELDIMRDMSSRSGGQYIDAPGAENLNTSFGRVQQTLLKQYVVEWKADDIEADAKKYDLEVSVEVGETKLRGAGEVTTPKIKSYKTLIIIGIILLVLVAAGAAIWWFFLKPKPEVVILCPVCKRQQLPDWDVCLFCLKSCKAKLNVTKGPAKGKLYPLVGKVVMIGKGQENAVKIPDPAVSTRHCGIAIDETKFEIKDMGSANGTFVNGKKVQARFLRNGDVINIGQSELKFESQIQDVETGDYGDDGT